MAGHSSDLLKPIFHCEAKPFVLVPGIGLEPQRHSFASPIPTCWYLKTLKCALPPARMLNICVTPDANPQHKSAEYRLQNFHVGKVANANPVSSGIWALMLQLSGCISGPCWRLSVWRGGQVTSPGLRGVWRLMRRGLMGRAAPGG